MNTTTWDALLLNDVMCVKCKLYATNGYTQNISVDRIHIFIRIYYTLVYDCMSFANVCLSLKRSSILVCFCAFHIWILNIHNYTCVWSFKRIFPLPQNMISNSNVHFFIRFFCRFCKMTVYFFFFSNLHFILPSTFTHSQCK